MAKDDVNDDANGGDGDDKNDSNDGNDGGNSEVSYEEWIEKQDDATKSIIEKHNKPLATAHERQKQVNKELKSTLDKVKRSNASDSEKAKQSQDAIEAATGKAMFYQECPRDITNPKAAFAIAAANDCLRSDGSLDVEKFRTDFPEQFGGVKKKAPKSNAGPGSNTNNNDAPKKDMNAAIRAASGR